MGIHLGEVGQPIVIAVGVVRIGTEGIHLGTVGQPVVVAVRVVRVRARRRLGVAAEPVSVQVVEDVEARRP